jgi:phosphotriesterase-related protein
MDQGRAGRILVSLDAGWYHVGEPGGGQFHSYAPFCMDLLPALQNTGISEAQIRDLIPENSRNALHPKLRLL